MRKNILNKLNVLVYALLIIFVAMFTACAKDDIVVKEWKDNLPAPEVTLPEVISSMPTPPPKPIAPPELDAGQIPSVGNITASNSSVVVTQQFDKVDISYNDQTDKVADWTYVYLPINNYESTYCNLIIKAQATSVEKVTVQAVYYEQYDLNYPCVTLLVADITEGEQTIIAPFGDANIIGKDYNIVAGQMLKDKLILGFMVFFDTNPKLINLDRAGSVALNTVRLAKENDPDLDVLFAPPKVRSITGNGFGQVSIDDSKTSSITNNKNAAVSYGVGANMYATIDFNIANYKSVFTTLKFKLKGTDVKSVSIAITYSLGSTVMKYAFLNGAYGIAVAKEFDTYEFDFEYLEESIDFSSSMPGSYVKNLRPTAIQFFIDGGLAESNSGTLEIIDFELIKNVNEGSPKITPTWTHGVDGITKTDSAEGGLATITYSKSQGWNSVNVNVSGYLPEYSKLTVRVKFYGSSNIGIAIGYGSANTVIKNSDDKTSGAIKIKDDIIEGTDDKGNYTLHVYTIDFAAAEINGVLLTAKNINQIKFYIDSVVVSGGATIDTPAGMTYPDSRIMQFVGISFSV